MAATRHPATTGFSARVTRLRKARKMTLEQLSLACGVSRSMLSQIERGTANPTLAVSFKIAEGFGIAISDLLDEAWTAPQIDIVHGDDPKAVFCNQDGCRLRTLSPLRIEKSVEFYELRLDIGAALISEAHYQGTRELLTVANGCVEVAAQATSRQLNTGDTAYYRADVAHEIRQAGNAAAVCYLVVSYSGP